LRSGLKKTFIFIKKIINIGDKAGIPNPTGMMFDFSSPLGMGRVTGKYMRVWYENGEDKTCLHPAPLPCLKTIGYKLIRYLK